MVWIVCNVLGSRLRRRSWALCGAFLGVGLAACSGGETVTSASGTTDDGTTAGETSTTTVGSTTAPSTSQTTTVGETTTTTTTTTTTGTTSEPTTTGTTSEPTTTGTTTGTMDPVCGDGVVEGDEACDDGNGEDGDACTNACTIAVCGDGVVEIGVEGCDDGNDQDDDACVAGCVPAACGDGYLQAGVEGCDDGNVAPDDGCTEDCLIETCGNGKAEGLEACDDGNKSNTDDCTTFCQLAACGDAFLHEGVEECDDGNKDTDDLCVACNFAYCGDGYIRKGAEVCDDGNDVNTDGCVACFTAYCGDGFVYEGVEECDDANQNEADACTAMCKAPACDDGAKNGGETDVDCGNGCPKCEVGKACGDSDDCTTGYCLSNVCTPTPVSCKTIKADDPQAASGKYVIDIDGPGPIPAVDVYCDMEHSGGGWTVFYATSGGDGEQPIVSNIEALAGNPLAFEPYSVSRLKKAGLSQVSTETLFVRPGDIWLRVSATAVDNGLLVPNNTVKKAVTLTSSDNVSVPAFMGYANHTFNHGGDFGLSLSPDAMTCANINTVTGFDHHPTSFSYRMLNCSCLRQYMHSRSSVDADADAGYDSLIGIGAWTATEVSCSATAPEGGKLKFYAAMR